MDTQNNDALDGIAIIGMACRFPMAKNVQEFWDNLVQGRDCVGTVSLDDARKAGVPEDVLNNPGYVRRGGRISDPEMFDAQFFGFSPKDAAIMDPQQRLFLQCGWKAIESAGYDVSAIKFPVAVFGGSNLNFYLLNNVINNPGVLKTYSELQTLFSSDKDHLATRLSYKFNLTGPSMTVQTGCSTSLVATHLACQCLLTYQCDMALAGGVSLQIPWWNGYICGDADIRSPDGTCRPFDAKANGTVFGEGCGIVVLKRLQDALKDNDHIFAVIRGSAINNDGSLKAGYTAPSVDGQTNVITSALDIASVSASDVSYVEAHGTGTPLGDPVEITALTKAYRHYTNATGFCGIGSVKASIGHLDAAAGIAGLIKTTLALYHKKLPQTVHFSQPNPLLELEKTPFYVVNALKEWQVPENARRIAGVSSLGVGGTNAHIIVEEPPRVPVQPSKAKYFIFPVSARSQGSLKKIAKAFTSYLPVTTDAVADIAYTLQYGRQSFPFRQFVITDSAQNAIEQFTRISEKDSFPKVSSNESERIVFMFSGQGSQYVNMAKDLYNDVPVFKTAFDYCCEQFKKHTNKDLREIIFNDNESNSALLQQTDITQPALFTIEYSLVKFWETLGIKPSAMIGHSIGEYIAACISGVFSLNDTIAIIAERARLMYAQPSGKMLSISKSVNDILPMLDSSLELALVNSPDLCVVAGTEENLHKFQNRLQEQQIECWLLRTSHAFHSELMAGAVEPFTEFISKFKRQAPSIPFVSNVTGTWITNEEACDPAYWGKHIRNTVQFADGVTTLLNDQYRIFIEIGPSNSLCTLVGRTASALNGQKGNDNSRQVLTLSSIRQPKITVTDMLFLLSSLSQLWQHGLKIDWQAVSPNENRRRIPIPTYQFDEKRHWIDPVQHIFTGMGVSQELQSATIPITSGIEYEEATVSNFVSTDDESTESILTSIWNSLLGTDTIDPSISFFELGGDSIWATQMLARVQKKTGIAITVGDLYKNPSIKSFASFIDGNYGISTGKNKKNEPKRLTLTKGLIPSNAQQRLWFIQTLEPNSPANNLASEFEICGPLDTSIVKKTLDILVSRHDAFRTIFYQTNDDLRCEIQETVNYPFEILDFSSVAPLPEKKWLSEICNRSIIQYNLQTGPLVRFLLIKFSETKHILTLMCHHIISDGWSMGVFMRDFAVIYNALSKGQSPILPDLTYRFADYAHWQSTQNHLIDSTILEYWKDNLSGSLPVLELPSDKHRPPVLSYKGSCVHFFLDKKTSKKLETLTKNEQTTPFCALLSTFYMLLYRYSGQQDIIIGAPLANRKNVDVENLIGLFLNMIPLRIKSTNSMSIRQLFNHVKTTVHDAFTHQDVPLNVLVETIKPQRDMSHPPIFQVMFAYQNFPIEPLVFDQLTISPLLVDRGATEYDLSLYMWPENDTIQGNIEYSTDLFSHQQIECLCRHFINIAESVVNTFDTKINDINLLAADELQLITSTWNKTEVPFPKDKCIHHLFKERVQESPNATAVIFKDQSLTYKELDIQSDKIATLLFEKGVRQGDLVGICLERHLGMVASLIGIYKVAATYVPLDPNFPQERIQYMADDAGLKAIVTEDTVLNRIANVKNSLIIKIQPDISLTSDYTVSIQLPEATPDSIAYILYTSGSTGKPKGVRIPHRAVVNFLLSMQRKPGITPTDRVLAMTTLSFDISVLELFLPLVSGACTVIVDNETSKDGQKLIKCIDKTVPTIIQGTPSMWRMLLAAGWQGKSMLKTLCGGEALPYDLVRDLLPKVGSLWNMYGPTEATVWATVYQITDPNASILIGFPIDNIFTYILDSNLKPVPIGVAGELFLGGVGLADGYHNKPDLTNEKFMTSPFSKGMMYRTGDLARYRQNGAIEFMGRIDSQVKIRGFRIELGEIENVALSHPQIRQCVAICKEYTTGDLRLILYFSLQTQGALTSTEIRSHLREQLPEYMVPQHFIELESLPLTPAGKIDRKSLPSPFQNEKDNQKSEPSSPGELYLSSIWKRVLGISVIHTNDNFFDLGGHSLLSVKVVTQVKKERGIDIDPKALILSTLEQIAANYNFNNALENTIAPKSGEQKHGLFENIRNILKKRN